MRCKMKAMITQYFLMLRHAVDVGARKRRVLPVTIQHIYIVITYNIYIYIIYIVKIYTIYIYIYI